ncbi:MAG: response regulator [Lachnospiraceae bacterium]|nr:response regulator [Lachnospiraceae bacterium]
MYKILLCDDEGIVREGLKVLIGKEFGGNCLIEEAKSGRIAIEKSASFRPDIIFMDIQMPGINGIEAMREIRKSDKNVIFIVLTAYDRFTYAKESIDVGVLDYLTKPFNKTTVLSIISRAILQIDAYRNKVSQEMEAREKLEMVIPIIESGFVSGIFLQDSYLDDSEQYKAFLGIEEESGYMILVRYGDVTTDGGLSNPVGAGVKAMKSSKGMMEILKEFFPTGLTTVLGNRAVLFVPYPNEEMPYEERMLCIERTREMVRKLEQKLEMRFVAGIGNVTSFLHLSKSYKESVKACKQGSSKVNHIQDIQKEKAGDGKSKTLELILRSEQQVYLQYEIAFDLDEWEGYLEYIMRGAHFADSEVWFLEKMLDAANDITVKQQERSGGVVEKAMEYIEKNFTKEISLDDISHLVDVSPYYFSKIFKEMQGINFVEYLTNLRINYAKELLLSEDYSIKEICLMVGYTDPNYFSRLFKKWTNRTPSEYREGEIS